MPLARRINRRDFLIEFGRGTLAVAIFGVGVACGDNAATTTSSTLRATTTAATVPTTAATVPTTVMPSTTTEPASQATIPAGPVSWHRVDFDFVSAYLLVRGDKVALVDTGTGGATRIEEGLAAAGTGWDAIEHLIVTHKHPDHTGGISSVLERAQKALVYAGAEDIPLISSPRPISSVGDGDEVFGLQIVATPGHTPGHISVLDPLGGLLVAGDALNGADAAGGVAGEVVGPNPAFTEDLAMAADSVRKLAALSFETLVFGHGEPIEGNAAAKVVELAEGL